MSGGLVEDRISVLHIITRLDPGGSAENTLLACHHLAARGWDAGLASGPGWTGRDAEAGGVDLPVTLIPQLRRDPSPLADLRALWQIYRLLRRERPDVLHTHSAKAGILGRWAGFFAGVKHIVHTPHGHVLYGYARGPRNWAYLLAERMTAPITHRLVALSEGERRESAAARIGTLEKWVVIPSGVDLTGIEPRVRLPQPSAPLRVGVVARLEHVKGVDVLVEASAMLAASGAPPFEVLVWGEGREQEALVALSQRLGTAGLVRFVGTAEPVARFLDGLDVYAQPSRNEGMGRALVLAQGAGLPIVASRVCGIPDVVRDGETGILVEPGDPAALAAGLERLLADPGRRDRYAAAARSWVLSDDETGLPRFSVEAMLWRLEGLYRRLAG